MSPPNIPPIHVLPSLPISFRAAPAGRDGRWMDESAPPIITAMAYPYRGVQGRDAEPAMMCGYLGAVVGSPRRDRREQRERGAAHPAHMVDIGQARAQSSVHHGAVEVAPHEAAHGEHELAYLLYRELRETRLRQPAVWKTPGLGRTGSSVCRTRRPAGFRRDSVWQPDARRQGARHPKSR
jgi:hypothetical protein